MKDSWTAAITDELLRLKQRGVYDFPRAWEIAVRVCPPRGRDAGVRDGALFDPGGGGETMVAFTRRVCRDAWTGDRPGLAGFTAAALRLSVGRDLSRDAGGHRHWDRAA